MSVKEKQQNTFTALKDTLGYTNPMQAPRIEKVVISVGTGSLKDPEKAKLIPDRLSKITGQKPSPRGARKSIASFKLREGDIIGHQVTLRGPRMRQFLDKFLNTALPRMRDFHGLSPASIDEVGNYTLGIREHTIFPETSDEELKNVFGMSITVVTSASTPHEAKQFLSHLGFPFVE